MFDVSKVDATIENLSERICSIEFTTYGDIDHIKDMTFALAELVKARALIKDK